MFFPANGNEKERIEKKGGENRRTINFPQTSLKILFRNHLWKF
jgi:hypothetical protein